MILTFKEQFKEKILAETKIHTVREDETGRWEIGTKIQFTTCGRFQKKTYFKEGVCTRTKRVLMSYAWNDIIEISIGGKMLFGHNERMEFAKNDGFDTWEDFFNWFYPKIKASENGYYTAKLIQWTDFDYK